MVLGGRIPMHDGRQPVEKGFLDAALGEAQEG
jgi:hypothetical protein